MVALVNCMHGVGWLGNSNVNYRLGPPSEAQVASLERIYAAAVYFVGDDDTIIPDKKWKEELSQQRLRYGDEAAVKAVPLTWKQIEAALPPEGLAGSIHAVDLAEGAMLHALNCPDEVLLPTSEWVDRVPTARVNVAPGAWPEIATGLHRTGICELIKESECLSHNSRLLAGGLFGVGKGKDVPGSPGLEALRLICNLVPSNMLQVAIRGDVAKLPFFGQWCFVELLRQEILLWSAEDIVCAFYVFRLPRAWRRLRTEEGRLRRGGRRGGGGG